MEVAIELLAAITALVLALAGLLGVLLVQSVKARSEAAKTAAEISAMRINTAETAEQVKNSHATNLRDDLDATNLTVMHTAAAVGRMEAAVSRLEVVWTDTADDIRRIDTRQQGMVDDLRQVRDDQQQIRADLADERKARELLDKHAHDTHADIYRRLNSICPPRRPE